MSRTTVSLNNHENKPRYSVWSNAQFVVQGINEFDKSLLGFMAINVLFTAISQFVPVFMPKYIIDELIQGGNGKTVIFIVLAFSLLALISDSINKTSHNTISSRFITVRLRFIVRSGQKFMTTDFQSLENPDVLDMSQKGDRACNDNQHGVEGVMHRLLSISSRLLVLAGCSALIITLHPVLILAICALLTINFVISSNARKRDKKVNDSLAKVRRKLDYITNVMSNFAYGKDLRLFNLKDFLSTKYTQEQKTQFSGTTQIQQIWLGAKSLHAVTGLLQEALLYAWLCLRVIAGEMSIADFTMYATAIRTFAGALGGLLDDISHIKQQNEIISDHRAFLDYPNMSPGSAHLPEHITTTSCAFEFRNVSFRYPGRQEYALQDVSVCISAGERLAIVGLNGAGKSTFVKLLTRLYEPEAGCILLNGVDVRTYDKQEYYRLFSIVFQDIQLFAFTVAENVSMNEYGITDIARVTDGIAQAGLAEKVLKLPKGVDTAMLKVIDEGGIELSGGENQKLALARALYKNAPVLVLDEPTAALDALAEEKLYREFDSLIGNRTAVYISHRLSSTRFCDRVLLFSEGRIVESGTHHSLMNEGGKYAEMFAMQAKYYNEEAHTA